MNTLRPVEKKYYGYSEHFYVSDDGYVVRREHGKTPNGNELGGRWVLREITGRFIDYDQYRNDLAERHGYRIATGNEAANV